MRLLLTLLLVSLVAVPVMAGPPAIGSFNAIDGRFSESWNGGEGQIGNTLHAMSWDNTTLGTEWILHCPVLFTDPMLISDTRVGGTGDVMYLTKYNGGTFWLSKSGPWGDGIDDYTGTVGITSVLSTHQFVGGTRVGVRSNVTVSGQFDNYQDCFVYTITNATFEGFPPMTFPANYPGFILSSCVPGGSGGWGTATQVTLTTLDATDPECNVPVQESTWGQVKSMYAE